MIKKFDKFTIYFKDRLDKAIEKIKDGTISSVIYNPKTVSFESR